MFDFFSVDPFTLDSNEVNEGQRETGQPFKSLDGALTSDNKHNFVVLFLLIYSSSLSSKPKKVFQGTFFALFNA
jgi:hypothetical protein